MTQTTNAMAQRRCLPPSMCSTAPSSAATCSATGTRSSSASSTPPRRRCRCEWRSTPSSTTTRPTNIPRCKNGWPGIPAGRFTSRLPRRPGSTPSKASSRNSRTAPQAWSVPVGSDLQAAINRFVEETNSDPKPFVWTADAKRVLAAVKRGKLQTTLVPPPFFVKHLFSPKEFC